MDLKNLRGWSGSIEEFADKAAETLSEIGRPEEEKPTIRLIRDYNQRGILGGVDKRGRAAVFTYDNLLRFLVARAFLSDGWPLSKIKEHIQFSSNAELEALLPGLPNRAMAAAQRIRRETPEAARSQKMPDRFRTRAARLSTVQGELRDALKKLGLPEDEPATEQLTLIALAPWCQLLVESSRLWSITIGEAEEIGRAVTASLLTASARKGSKS